MATGGETELKDTSGSVYIFDNICQPCNNRGKSLEAVGLCRDCEEYLCEKCFTCHTIPTPTQDHVLLNRKEMLENKESMAIKDKCTEKCENHDDKVIEFYCSSHSFLGCYVCFLLNHRSCDGVKHIPEVAKDIIHTEEFKEFEKKQKSVNQQSDQIIALAEKDIKEVENSDSKTSLAIKNFRREINDALDKLEHDLYTKADEIKKSETTKLKTISETCLFKQREIQSMTCQMETLQNTKQYCNLYIAMMRTKGKLNTLEDELKAAESNIKVKICSFKQNSKLIKMLKQPDGLGILDEEGKGVIMKAVYLMDINVQTKTDTRCPDIRGIAVLSHNTLVLTDSNNNNVKLVDTSKGKVTDELKLTSAPRDLVLVNDSQAAVSLPNENTIVMVRLSPSLNVDESIRVNGTCYGVTFCEGKLIVSFSSPGMVEIMDLKGNVHQKITSDSHGQLLLSNPYHVNTSLDKKHMHVSNYGNNSVVCLRLDGTLVAKYTDSQLKGSLDCATDKNGMIYVCGVNSNNIHQITAHYKKAKLLLTGADGLYRPISIAYCDIEDKFYIGMLSSNIIKVFKAFQDTQ